MNTTYTFEDDRSYEIWFDGQLFGLAGGADARILYRHAVRPERYEFRLVGDDAPDADDLPEAEVVWDGRPNTTRQLLNWRNGTGRQDPTIDVDDTFHGWLRSEPVAEWIRNGGPKPAGDPRPTLDTHFEDGVDGTPLIRTPGRGRYADLIQEPPKATGFAWFVSFLVFTVALAIVTAVLR